MEISNQRLRQVTGTGLTVIGIGLILLGLGQLAPVPLIFSALGGGSLAAGPFSLMLTAFTGIGIMVIGIGCVIIGRGIRV